VVHIVLATLSHPYHNTPLLWGRGERGMKGRGETGMRETLMVGEVRE
jgi:hypothetical protein